MFNFLTPELFDALVIATMLVGSALAALRFYQDLRRPVEEAPFDDAVFEDDPET